MSAIPLESVTTSFADVDENVKQDYIYGFKLCMPTSKISL